MRSWAEFINLIPPCLRLGNNNSPGVVNSLKDCAIKSITYWTERLVFIAVIVAFVYLVIGGFQMATAIGDEQKYAQAKKTVIYALIGVAVSSLSSMVVYGFANFLGGNGP